MKIFEVFFLFKNLFYLNNKKSNPSGVIQIKFKKSTDAENCIKVSRAQQKKIKNYEIMK